MKALARLAFEWPWMLRSAGCLSGLLAVAVYAAR
jgi:hypothetical protein